VSGSRDQREPTTHRADRPTIRTASATDAELLWRWANDAETRRWSFHSDPVSWETHVAWLDAKLADPAARVFIVGVRDVPKAVVRFELADDDVAVVSLIVDPDERGRGWGPRALRMACRSAAHELAVLRIDAYIKPANTASVVAFERAGFVRAESKRPDALKLVWQPAP
jgi:RimJ/RimL family protein N-acetyltransferase